MPHPHRCLPNFMSQRRLSMSMELPRTHRLRSTLPCQSFLSMAAALPFSQLDSLPLSFTHLALAPATLLAQAPLDRLTTMVTPVHQSPTLSQPTVARHPLSSTAATQLRALLAPPPPRTVPHILPFTLTRSTTMAATHRTPSAPQ
jgi:hypothetical protein